MLKLITIFRCYICNQVSGSLAKDAKVWLPLLDPQINSRFVPSKCSAAHCQIMTINRGNCPHLYFIQPY